MTTEKERRVYYQDIVYYVCNVLDALAGKSCLTGEGIACGTADEPTREVQDRMDLLAAEVRRLRLMARDEPQCEFWGRNTIESDHYDCWFRTPEARAAFTPATVREKWLDINLEHGDPNEMWLAFSKWLDEQEGKR